MWIYILYFNDDRSPLFVDRISDQESDARWWAQGFPDDIVMAYEIGV